MEFFIPACDSSPRIEVSYACFLKGLLTGVLRLISETFALVCGPTAFLLGYHTGGFYLDGNDILEVTP